MPGSSLSFQATEPRAAIPPPLPSRQPVHNYSGYNDYRPYGSSYYGNYGYLGGYRGYGGYNSFGNYMSYSGNNYAQIGGHSGDAESRYIQETITYKYYYKYVSRNYIYIADFNNMRRKVQGRLSV